MTDVFIAGQYLKRLRVDRELTQQELVQRVERETGITVSAQTLGKLENGQVEKPSMVDLVSIGKVFKLSPNEVSNLYGYSTHAPFTGDKRLDEVERIVEELKSRPNERNQLLDLMLQLAKARL